MAGKICENCGKNVNDSVKFCPYCGTSQFRQTTVPISNKSSSIPTNRKSQNNDWIHKLFYWKYDEGYIFSKTKLISILTFIAFVLSIFNQDPGAIILLGLIFASIFDVIGWSIHRILGRDKPSENVLKNNNFGFLEDLKNALLFWQNKDTGEFALSKTKIITLLVFGFFSAICINTAPSLVADLTIGVIFASLTCALGYSIHKLVNNNPTPKKVIQKPEPQITPNNNEKKPEVQASPKIIEKRPEFRLYQSQLNDLRKDYDVKEKHLKDLIEKRFEPPQLTYNKFMASVDNCTNMFDSQADSIQSIIDLASDDSKRIDDELKSKIGVLKSLIDKIDDLTNELVLNMGKSDDENVKSLLNDMDDLIESVNNYD